jgi:hypothetical protein
MFFAHLLPLSDNLGRSHGMFRNIHTLNTLYNYGYTNFYELGPLIDIRKAKLRFEGTQLEAP